MDLVADDDRNYRLAFIDAFRRRGIYPEDIKTLSMESLRYHLLNISSNESDDEAIRDEVSWETRKYLGVIIDFLREYGNKLKYINNRQDIYDKTKDYIKYKKEQAGPVCII